jgi:membrane associated rhomboid family serine protease
MFLHGGWMHLIGNMMYLYIFGDNIEEILGRVKFLLFYFITGIIAALTQALLDPSSTIPMIGASGAIAGILGGYLVLYPKANIKVFFWFIIFFKVFRIRAFIVLGGWILIQLFSFSGDGFNTGGVAYGAHIGGFVAGAILIKFFHRKKSHIKKSFKGSVPNAK